MVYLILKCGSISVLPTFREFLEKLIHKRLSDYLSKYNILHDHHFGFQKGKSTEHATSDLYANIIKTIQKHKKTFNFSRFC